MRYFRAESSLASFVQQAWVIIEPGTRLLWNWHLDLICEHLEAVTRGECAALAINVPPRYMKSLLVSVMWPCWEWIGRPERRYLCASYSAGLSTLHSLSRRRIIASDWYLTGMHDYWGQPDFALADDQNAKTQYENSHRGHMLATSVGGMATGQGGDRVIIDDPLNPAEAASDAERNTANRFWDETLSTRLNDKARGAFVLVMQRLHEDDMTGHVLKEGGWTHVCLPAVAEHDEDVVFPSGRIVHREAGSALWPERENAEQIERVKIRLGSYGYSGQYQQRPSPAEGGLFKRTWWRYYRQRDLELLRPKMTDFKQSWDMTFKDSIGTDFVAGGFTGRIGADIYLLDAVHERMDFPATLRAFRAFTARHPEAIEKLVEDKANGSAVISTLKHEIMGLVAIEPQGGKYARANAASPTIEAGNVWLPHPDEVPWVSDLVEECAVFPNGPHDDYVDMLSQVLRRYANSYIWAS